MTRVTNMNNWESRLGGNPCNNLASENQAQVCVFPRWKSAATSVCLLRHQFLLLTTVVVYLSERRGRLRPAGNCQTCSGTFPLSHRRQSGSGNPSLNARLLPPLQKQRHVPMANCITYPSPISPPPPQPERSLNYSSKLLTNHPIVIKYPTSL